VTRHQPTMQEIPRNLPTFAPTAKPGMSKNQCFAGTETVLVLISACPADEEKDGRCDIADRLSLTATANVSTYEVPISDVKVGDYILAADKNRVAKFSRVVAVPHPRNTDPARFVHVLTLSGVTIRVTPDHLLLAYRDCKQTTPSDSVSSNDAAPVLVTASRIQGGMCLVTAAGGPEFVTQVITAEVDIFAGVYTVVTEEEYIVVNGFIASPFSFHHSWALGYYRCAGAIAEVAQFFRIPVGVVSYVAAVSATFVNAVVTSILGHA
jgi:hypothetical protein